MNFKSVIAALIGLVALCGSVGASALVIDPAQCGVTLSCDTGNQNSNSAIVAAVQALYPGIVEVYKQDVGGGESGASSGDYTTSFFNSALDPSEALVQWDGPGIIDCNDCWLLVKDGNQQPSWYLINLTGWDGQEDLELENFWPANGAISHVSIFVRPIPIPAGVWLFASALIGLTGLRRARR